MGASWLRAFLEPLAIYVGGALQPRDNRVNFRNGFTASQVLDELGVPRLTIDVSLATATPDPTPNTVVSRNGSGSSSFTTLAARVLSLVNASENLRIELDAVNRRIRFYDNTGALTLTIDGETGQILFPDESILRTPFLNFFAASGWTVDGNGSAVNSSIGATIVGHVLELVPGATLTEIHVWVKPAGAHVGLPATMPSWTLYEGDSSTETAALLHGPVTDSSADVTAYELLHAISATGLSIAPDPERRAVLVFDAENGANALTGLEVRGMRVQLTVNKMRKS